MSKCGKPPLDSNGEARINLWSGGLGGVYDHAYQSFGYHIKEVSLLKVWGGCYAERSWGEVCNYIALRLTSTLDKVPFESEQLAMWPLFSFFHPLFPSLDHGKLSYCFSFDI